MQRLTRRSSALSSSPEQSDTGILESHDEQSLTGTGFSRKRANLRNVHSDEVLKPKRARRNSNKSKNSNDEVEDFIVVIPGSSKVPKNNNQEDNRDGSSKPPSSDSFAISEHTISTPGNQGTDRDVPDFVSKVANLGESPPRENENRNLELESPLSSINGASSKENKSHPAATTNDVSRIQTQIPASSSDPVVRSLSISPANSPHFSDSRESQSSPSAAKRTPLPTQKPDGTGSQVLSGPTRDPRFPLTRPVRRTSFKNDEESSIDQRVDSQLSKPPNEGTDVPAEEDISLRRVDAAVPALERHRGHAEIPSLDSTRKEQPPPTATLSIQTLVNSPETEKGPHRRPSQDTTSYNTFSSRFQVLTTELVEQNKQSGSKRRYRKKNSEERQSTVSPLVESENIFRPHPSTKYGESSRIVSSTEKGQIETTHSLSPSRPRMSELSSQRSDSINPSATPVDTARPSSSTPKVYRPPAVDFTIDNRAESSLPEAEVATLFESFSKRASIVVVPDTSQSQSRISPQPIGSLMWQTLPHFYSWYSGLTGINVTSSLKFELRDVHWQSQTSFVLRHGNADYFRALKQYIWDLYWISANINREISLFRVYVLSQFGDDEQVGLNISPSSQWIPEIDVGNKYQKQAHPNIHSGHVVTTDSLPESQAKYLPSHRQEPRATSKPAILPAFIGLPNSKPASSPPGPPYSTPRIADQNVGNWHTHRIPPRSGSDVSLTATDKAKMPMSRLVHPVEIKRTESDKEALRRAAYQLVPRDMELFAEESTVYDKYPYKTGAQVLGAVVDKMSGQGMVTITGKGYITLNIQTSLDPVEERYQRVNINTKQTCMLHNGAIVLYYKRRITEPVLMPPLQLVYVDPSDVSARNEILLGAKVSSHVGIEGNPRSGLFHRPSLAMETGESSSVQSEVTILVRIQVDRSGKFSTSYDKSYLRPSITVAEFFSWFTNQSGYPGPEPAALKFTFKDAMPAPTSTQISRDCDEDHFRYMRRDIKTQCAKAKGFMPDLKEFVILITVPGWEIPTEEDW